VVEGHKYLIMVYYFTSNVVTPPATIYVGKDKFESMTYHAPGAGFCSPACFLTDEELIKHGLESDVW
jgi:hypothetical protein